MQRPRCLLCGVLLLGAVLQTARGIAFSAVTISRRSAIRTAAASSVFGLLGQLAPPAWAADRQSDPVVGRFRKGLDGLDHLLANWDEETTDCSYADVDRSLLEGKNKEKLLKAATTNALFDKTNAVMSCKRNSKAVRAYLGLTSSDTPLYGAEVIMQKSARRVSPEQLDDYLTAVEEFQQAISAADSTARLVSVGDYSSFGQADAADGDENSYLTQSKHYVEGARAALAVIVAALEEPAT